MDTPSSPPVLDELPLDKFAFIYLLLLGAVWFIPRAVISSYQRPGSSGFDYYGGRPVLPMGTILTESLTATAVAVVTAAVFPCIVFGRQPLHKQLALFPPRGGAVAWVLAIIGAVGLVTAVSALLALLSGGPPPMLEEFGKLVRSLLYDDIVTVMALVGFVMPLAQELFFRGFALGRLRRQFGPDRAVVVTAAMFAVIHFNIEQGIVSFILGIWFGQMTIQFGSIWPAVAAHIAINAISISVLANPEIAESQAGGGRMLPLLVGSAVALGCGLGWGYFLRRKRSADPAAA